MCRLCRASISQLANAGSGRRDNAGKIVCVLIFRKDGLRLIGRSGSPDGVSSQAVQITLNPSGDLDALGRRWRALEAEADAGFFRSWTFLGCLAAERFAQPAQLLAVTQDGIDVALALLGRRRGRSWLNQTGSGELDRVFIEHNGLLVRSGRKDVVAAALSHAVRRGTALTLSGVDDDTLQAARRAGWVVPEQSRRAPRILLDQLEGSHLDTLSSNARAQIRRSMRRYGPELGLQRAETADQAARWFEELVELHQATWTQRGQPGAFADPQLRRFHTCLIARAWPRGEADLLRIQAGGRLVGLLYNFCKDRHVMNYQSGFSYDASAPHEKPGLVCHALAIAHYAAQDARVYDLLAGDQRYKRTLAQDGQTLHWATVYRPWSAMGVAARARHTAGLLKAAWVRRAQGHDRGA